MTRQNLHSKHSHPQAQYSRHYTTPDHGNGYSRQERKPVVLPNHRRLSVPPARQEFSAPQVGIQPPYPAAPPPVPAQHRHQRSPRLPARRRHPSRSRQAWLAGGSMLALAALIVVPKPSSTEGDVASEVCQQRVASQAVLSRGELSKLLAVPERSSKEAVQQIIDAPYCMLSPIEVREGVSAEREAYPLEFDPQTWFVVLYEEGEYAGYDFSFRQE